MAVSFGVLVPAPSPTPAPESPAAIFAMLVSQAMLLAWVGSRLSGTPRAASFALFTLAFGSMSVMSQIESAFFLDRMPLADAARVVLAGGVALACFCPLAVRVNRRARLAFAELPPNPGPAGASDWATRIAATSAIHLLLYFSFGYFVAWVRPEVHLYYGGTAPEGFVAHMAGLLRDQPELVPFQILRSGLWIALVLPVLRLFRGPRWLHAIAVGAVLAWLMNGQLLLPNPYMPEEVRMIHLVETASSNFVFGMALVWLLRPAGPSSARERAPAAA